MRKVLGLITVVLMVANCAPPRPIISEDEKQIRETRQLSNEAIAKHDSVSIANYWTQHFHVISSRNFEIVGREANRQFFAGDFKTKKGIKYVRTTEKVDLFKEWNMACESGTWVGEWQEEDGNVKLTGSYYAKWHKIDSQWKIRAEIFTPLSCNGSKFCTKNPKLY